MFVNSECQRFEDGSDRVSMELPKFHECSRRVGTWDVRTLLDCQHVVCDAWSQMSFLVIFSWTFHGVFVLPFGEKGHSYEDPGMISYNIYIYLESPKTLFQRFFFGSNVFVFLPEKHVFRCFQR